MPQLSHAHLFSATLPASWRPFIELIDELDALVVRKEQLGKDPAPDAATRDEARHAGDTLESLRQQANGVRRRLIAEAAERHEHAPVQLRASSEEHRRWFTEAALMWLWFNDSCGKVRLDTIGSTTLGRFPIDLDPDDAQREVLRRAIGQAFGWSDDELREIAQRKQHLISNLKVKRAITAALCDLVAPTRSPDPESVARLMFRVYGPGPDGEPIFQPGDVDLVITKTSVFLCLGIEGSGLGTPGFAERPESHRDIVADFIARMKKASSSSKNVRFPAFGMFDPALVDPALISELTAVAQAQPGLEQVDEQVIAETFATMVVLIPTSDVEMFLIHDTWGHGWQETLCEFEWLFHEFDELASPLEPAALVPAFWISNSGVALDRDKLIEIVHGDLRWRMVVGINLVVAEFLADLMEHKFTRYLDPLPSSSLLPLAPLKLDLSLVDSKRIRRLWSKPYRRLLHRPETRAGLEEALAHRLSERGIAPPGISEAVDEALTVIAKQFAPVLLLDDDRRPAAHRQPGDSPDSEDRIPANIVQRLGAGAATLDAALEHFLQRGDERYAELVEKHGEDFPRWKCPVACVDLVALILAWFYEQEHEVNIWHLDELLDAELWPSLIALEKAFAALDL